MSAWTRGLCIGFAAGVVVGAVVFGAKAASKPRGATGPSEPVEPREAIPWEEVVVAAPSPEEKVAKLRQDLMVKYFYDSDKVERAIQQERERDPNGTEEEWLRGAIMRWERDNR
jgi:hypothetical protein